MRTFTDKAGRTWMLDARLGTLKRVKALLGVDPLDVGTFANILESELFLGDVLWAFCREQAERLGIDQTAFEEAIDGDVLGEAAEALIGELLDFFRHPKHAAKREVLQTLLRLQQEAKTEAIQRAEKSLAAAIDNAMPIPGG